MAAYTQFNLNEQHLRLSLGTLIHTFDEDDWANTQPLLDDLYIKRKHTLASRTRRIVLFSVIILISAGFFSFMLFKEQLIPNGQKKESSVPIASDEENIKAGKIFTEVGPLETPLRTPGPKLKIVQAESKTDSTTVNLARPVKIDSLKSDSEIKKSEASTKKKKKEKVKEKETKTKKSKKKSPSSSSQPAKHNTKDDEIIIIE